MTKLKYKLALFNMLSKLAVSLLLLATLPYVLERINLRQIDNELIRKREQVIEIISTIGIEPFISADSTDGFGSYNILKEEFVSLERSEGEEEKNYIEVTKRLIENEEINFRVLNYSLIIDGHPYLLEVGRSIASIDQAKRNITIVLIVFITLIVLLTLVADLQYTNRLLAPLDKITDKLSEVPNPSLFDKTPISTTTSDFLKLDAALTGLMAQLEESFNKEREITVNISHEFLTPVSVMRSKLENLLIRRDINSNVADKVEESLKTLYRLQSLVTSLLKITRLESHQYLRNESFSVGDVLSEVISEVSPVAEDKGIAIELFLHDDFILNRGNRSLIFSMLYNVIYNGVKNTGSGGNINIVGTQAKRYYELAISDTGKGLSEGQLEKLFSRFKSRTDQSGEGTGIGLAITKSIADFHRIEVAVTSKIGSGTHFLFRFPENS
jgi:signal transduction histidine kinase